MAYCKFISAIKALRSVENAVEYIEDETKTHNPAFAQSVAIKYITDDKKTKNEQWREAVYNSFTDNDESIDKEYFISGVNCDVDNAHDQMIAAQQMSSKPIVNYAYHAVQSFKEAPGEMSPDTAHEIGVRLAKELWGNEFMVLVATHLNTDNYHNHFIICSTSPFTGKRFHKCDKTLWEMRNKSDELCREYGLDVIDKNNRKAKKSFGEREAEKRGEPTHKSILKSDCDIAIAQSDNWNSFVANLRKMGYQIQHSNTFINLKLDNWDRPIRIYFDGSKDVSLGIDYTRPAIEERIEASRKNNIHEQDTTAENKEPVFFDEEEEFDYKYQKAKNKQAKPIHTLPQNKQEYKNVNILPNVAHRKFKGTLKKAKRCNGSLLIIYYRITYKLCLKPMPARPKRKKRMSVYMRNEVNKLHKYLDQANFLAHSKIKTTSGLDMYLDFAKSQIHILNDERQDLRREQRSCKDPDRQVEIKAEISSINAKLKELRKNVTICEDIKTNSENVGKVCDNDSVRELKRSEFYKEVDITKQNETIISKKSHDKSRKD